MKSKRKTAGHLLAMVTIAIWGSTFIASKYMLGDFSPVQIMTMRFVIAWTVLFLIRPRFVKPVLRDELGFLLLGIFGCSLYFWCENTALTLTYASNVSIIVAMAPLLISILAHFFTRDEKFKPNLLAGFLVAFLGVALVVFNGAIVLKLNPIGDLLSLTSALCWAIYSILLKRRLGKYDNFVLTRKVMFYGFLTALPLLLIEGKPFRVEAFLDPVNVACLVFLGMLGSGACYVLWSVASERIGVVAAGNYIYAVPFVTMIAASLLLKEKISFMGIAGAVLIISGVLLCSNAGLLKRRQKETVSD